MGYTGDCRFPDRLASDCRQQEARALSNGMDLPASRSRPSATRGGTLLSFACEYSQVLERQNRRSAINFRGVIFPHAFSMHATCSVLLTTGWGLSFGSPVVPFL